MRTFTESAGENSDLMNAEVTRKCAAQESPLDCRTLRTAGPPEGHPARRRSDPWAAAREWDQMQHPARDQGTERAEKCSTLLPRCSAAGVNSMASGPERHKYCGDGTKLPNLGFAWSWAATTTSRNTQRKPARVRRPITAIHVTKRFVGHLRSATLLGWLVSGRN